MRTEPTYSCVSTFIHRGRSSSDVPTNSRCRFRVSKSQFVTGVTLHRSAFLLQSSCRKPSAKPRSKKWQFKGFFIMWAGNVYKHDRKRVKTINVSSGEFGPQIIHFQTLQFKKTVLSEAVPFGSRLNKQTGTFRFIQITKFFFVCFFLA